MGYPAENELEGLSRRAVTSMALSFSSLIVPSTLAFLAIPFSTKTGTALLLVAALSLPVLLISGLVLAYKSGNNVAPRFVAWSVVLLDLLIAYLATTSL